jgi:hypothetical protein
MRYALYSITPGERFNAEINNNNNNNNIWAG